MAELDRSGAFVRVADKAPPFVRRELMRLLSRMTATDPASIFPGDREITLFVPTQITATMHVLDGTGWSVLYVVRNGRYLLRFLCKTPEV